MDQLLHETDGNRQMANEIIRRLLTPYRGYEQGTVNATPRVSEIELNTHFTPYLGSSLGLFLRKIRISNDRNIFRH